MNYDKKAQSLYTQIIPSIISAIIIIIILSLFSISVDATSDSFEVEKPEIFNPYPITFIHTFLHEELNNNEKTELGINNETKFLIKDLIKLEHTPKVLEIYTKKRENYILSYEKTNSLNLYQNKYKVSKSGDELLILEKISSLGDLDCLEDSNYAFYVPDSEAISSKLSVIIFKESDNCNLKDKLKDIKIN